MQIFIYRKKERQADKLRFGLYKNRNVHHFSPSEGQSCVVLAMGPARPRPQSRRLGRGDGVYHTPGSGPARLGRGCGEGEFAHPPP